MRLYKYCIWVSSGKQKQRNTCMSGNPKYNYINTVNEFVLNKMSMNSIQSNLKTGTKIL